MPDNRAFTQRCTARPRAIQSCGPTLARPIMEPHQVDDFPWFPPGRLPDQECPKSPDKPAWLEASYSQSRGNEERLTAFLIPRA
jgi:hypothetical protein